MKEWIRLMEFPSRKQTWWKAAMVCLAFSALTFAEIRVFGKVGDTPLLCTLCKYFGYLWNMPRPAEFFQGGGK